MDEITCYSCAKFGGIVKFTGGTVIFKCLGAGKAIEFKHPEITCKYYKPQGVIDYEIRSNGNSTLL